jgi:hypothetical protein
MFDNLSRSTQQYLVIIVIADYAFAVIDIVIAFAFSGFFIRINDRCGDCYKVGQRYYY